MAQKAPHVSTLCQTIVPLPIVRHLKVENHSCFLTSLKGDLASEGSENMMLVAAGHCCHATLPHLLLCGKVDTATYAYSLRRNLNAQTHSRQTKVFVTAGYQKSLQNCSILQVQFGQGSSEYMRIKKKKKANRGPSIGLYMLY